MEEGRFACGGLAEDDEFEEVVWREGGGVEVSRWEAGGGERGEGVRTKTRPGRFEGVLHCCDAEYMLMILACSCQ